mgnify:CR=1 FL=1
MGLMRNIFCKISFFNIQLISYQSLNPINLKIKKLFYSALFFIRIDQAKTQ